MAEVKIQKTARAYEVVDEAGHGRGYSVCLENVFYGIVSEVVAGNPTVPEIVAYPVSNELS